MDILSTIQIIAEASPALLAVQMEKSLQKNPSILEGYALQVISAIENEDSSLVWQKTPIIDDINQNLHPREYWRVIKIHRSQN